MSLFDVLGAGRSGLAAASTGLATTTHNVSNATTRGFTRRGIQLATADPLRRGAHWLGQGVVISRIGRSADALALGRLLASSGEAQRASAEHAALASMEGLFEPGAGPSLRQSVDTLFDAFSAATADPSDHGLRRNVLEAAEQMASTISRLARGLEQGMTLRQESLSATLQEVNADLAEVAALNEAIVGAGGPLSAGDLADRRDLALARLAERIGATASFERDGTATVRIAEHAAVSGAYARTLAAVTEPGQDPRVTLSVDEGAVDITSEVGGSVGGDISARQTLGAWLGELDTLATELAGALNARHQAGYTRQGTPGGALFSLPAQGSAAAGLRLAPGVAADPSALAFASSPAGLAGDGGNLRALADLEKAVLASGQTPGGAASALTSRVGSEVASARVRSETASATRADAEELYANLTSVDLDEEAVKLVQYQAAYQAAAKVVAATDEMLKTLMQLGG